MNVTDVCVYCTITLASIAWIIFLRRILTISVVLLLPFSMILGFLTVIFGLIIVRTIGHFSLIPTGSGGGFEFSFAFVGLFSV